MHDPFPVARLRNVVHRLCGTRSQNATGRQKPLLNPIIQVMMGVRRNRATPRTPCRRRQFRQANLCEDSQHLLLRDSPAPRRWRPYAAFPQHRRHKVLQIQASMMAMEDEDCARNIGGIRGVPFEKFLSSVYKDVCGMESGNASFRSCS